MLLSSAAVLWKQQLHMDPSIALKQWQHKCVSKVSGKGQDSAWSFLQCLILAGARIGSYVGIVTDFPMPGQLVELNKQVMATANTLQCQPIAQASCWGYGKQESLQLSTELQWCNQIHHGDSMS
ncbi:unnamed protein product [Sphagnum tenellum]